MKTKLLILSLVLSFVLVSFSFSERREQIAVESTIKFYTDEAGLFSRTLEGLDSAVREISGGSVTIIKARRALIVCRLQYKRIEFFTSYFFPSETRFYNAAPKFEVEEPTLELVEPMGLQQIESLLFDKDVKTNKTLLLAHTEALLSSAKVLPVLLFNFEANDEQILESIRLQLVRLSVLSLSGYDAPLLKTGILEIAETTEALAQVLAPYLLLPSTEAESIKRLLKQSSEYLRQNPDFDSFNRMEYLTRYALPLQKHFGTFIRQQQLEINTTAFLNYDAEHIYSRDAIKSLQQPYSKESGQKALIAFGNKLFFDKSLSGNSSVSCASCHQPENYFSDLLPTSPSINPDSVLKRNTPTLFYAGGQHTQFWDGRASNLTSQIHQVILNPVEMNGSAESLNKKVFSNSAYRALVAASFPGKKPEDMGMNELTLAIAAFINELNPMNSAFDKYLAGEAKAMNTGQLKGFNLFMGKAQCGTCHFPPYFNSLLPPLYDISEVEVLGTPKSSDFKSPLPDDDMGRYNIFQIQYYRRAFKTPTVRNSARTAPYMHNGAFSSLSKVIEFYNLGGGNGIGLDVPGQTLSATPLNLSETEINNLISFIESLTDSPINIKNQ